MPALAAISSLSNELLVHIGTWLGVQLCVDRAERLGRVSPRRLTIFWVFIGRHRIDADAVREQILDRQL